MRCERGLSPVHTSNNVERCSDIVAGVDRALRCCRRRRPSSAVIAQPVFDTHFTVSRTVEHRIDIRRAVKMYYCDKHTTVGLDPRISRTRLTDLAEMCCISLRNK